MFAYIIGTVTDIESNYIVVKNNNIGYMINVANSYSYSLDEEVKVYIYNHIREDEVSLYGFKSIDEKNLFLKLTSVKGVGPKMALPILATGSISGIMDAIERENILYLKKFPKIGDKVARQIILDLKGKLVKTENNNNIGEYEDVTSALIGLGYKIIDIKRILPSLKKDDSVELQIKEALKLLLK